MNKVMGSLTSLYILTYQKLRVRSTLNLSFPQDTYEARRTTKLNKYFPSMKFDGYSIEPYKEHGDKCHAQ